ncbi:MAG: tetratricopeptide repeat protein, partial [Limisphaerales bacterium]
NQFSQTADQATAERIAKDCLMLPPRSDSLDTLAKMADTAVAAGTNNGDWPYYAFVKGLAEYRQDHFAGAVEWLRKVAPTDAIPARTAEVYATMAMAQFKLGRTEAARATLAQGLKVGKTYLAQPGRIDWNDQLIAQLLLREARQVVTASAGSGQ